MIDRPSGSYIEDPETGEITPNLADPAMAAREEASSGHRAIGPSGLGLNDSMTQRPNDPIDSTTKEEQC